MKWLEVIKLRSVDKGSWLLEEFSLPTAKVGQSGLVEMKTYRHAALETDLSVHLHWKSERPEQNGSTLGLRLAQAFREFGLVDHSVWIEEEGESGKNGPRLWGSCGPVTRGRVSKVNSRSS